MDRVPNTKYMDKEVVWGMKEVDKRIDEGVLWCFGHVDRIEESLCRIVCW